MTPIESLDDIRLLTLAGVAVDALNELSLIKDENTDTLLAECLFRVTKQIHEQGQGLVAERLLVLFPILNEAIS